MHEQEVADQLRSAGVDMVVSLPCDKNKGFTDLIHDRFDVVDVTREEDCKALVERTVERFGGVVSGCERFGLFVTLDETYAEGLVPVRALGGEWFTFDEDRMTLTGESSGETWGLGRRVVVEVTGVNVPRGQIDLALVRMG